MSEEAKRRSGANRTVCPKCGVRQAYRKTRKTFFQKQVMGFFGLYPWECGSCHQRYYSKDRGERRRDKVPENPWTSKEQTPPAA